MKQKKYDIFISYRRSSYDTANLIATRLTAAGYSVFFDMETLRSGKFNEQLFDVIDNCTDFLVVLPPGALDRCVNDDDWVRLEVCRAMAKNKNIIPVALNGFIWPDVMPQGMEELSNYQALTASSVEYFDLSLQRLQERYLHSKRHRSTKRAMMRLAVVLGVMAFVLAMSLVIFRIVAKGTCEDYATRMTTHTSRIHVLAEENISLETDWNKFLKAWDRKTAQKDRLILKEDFLTRLDLAEQNVAMLIPADTTMWEFTGYERFLLSLYGINSAELAIVPELAKLYLTDYIDQLNIYRVYLEDCSLSSVETEWGTALFSVQKHSINGFYASYLSLLKNFPESARAIYDQHSSMWKHFPNYVTDGSDKYYEDIIIKEGQLIDDLLARYSQYLTVVEDEFEKMESQLDELEVIAETYEANQQELIARQSNVQTKEALVEAKRAELRELDRQHIELYEQLKAKDKLEETDDQWYKWGKIRNWGKYMSLLVESRQDMKSKGVYSTSSITPEVAYADMNSMLTVYQTYHPESAAYVPSAKKFFKEVSEGKRPYAGVIIFAFKDDAVHPYFKQGDIIIKYCGSLIKNYEDLNNAFKADKNGEVVFLRLKDNYFEEITEQIKDTGIVGFLDLTD